MRKFTHCSELLLTVKSRKKQQHTNDYVVEEKGLAWQKKKKDKNKINNIHTNTHTHTHTQRQLFYSYVSLNVGRITRL